MFKPQGIKIRKQSKPRLTVLLTRLREWSTASTSKSWPAIAEQERGKGNKTVDGVKGDDKYG